MAYRVSYQDFRGWREVMMQPMPPVFAEVFDDKAVADARKKHLIALGMTACVTLVPSPWARKKSRRLVDTGAPRFNEDWKLAR